MVKGAYSKDMLAYKGALLDVAIARDTHGKGSAISKIF